MSGIETDNVTPKDKSDNKEPKSMIKDFFVEPGYDKDELDAIKAVVDVVQSIPPFLVDMSGELASEYLPYREKKRTGVYKYRLHSGQRKLYLSELDFLTRQLMKLDGGHKADIHILYVGAAPGTHINLLARKFPNVRWSLVDPAPFSDSLRRSEKVALYNEYFNDEFAKKIAGKVDYFISDIRISNGNIEKNWEVTEQSEASIQNDMDNQKRWVQLIRPRFALLKFRLPWQAGSTKRYLAGDIYVQAYARQNSTEARLVTDGQKETVYDSDMYNNWYYHHNRIRREWMFYMHDVEATGLCHCYDCALEVQIHYQYLSLATRTLQNKIAAKDAGKQVDELSTWLRRDLREGEHGSMPHEHMTVKRQQLYTAYLSVSEATDTGTRKFSEGVMSMHGRRSRNNVTRRQ